MSILFHKHIIILCSRNRAAEWAKMKEMYVSTVNDCIVKHVESLLIPTGRLAF